MSGLHTINCSRASADQRAGRAGRLGPGVAIRLWSKAEHAARPPHAPPAITEDDMAPVTLDLARRAIIDPTTLPFLTAPDPARWAKAVELLTTLGALDDTGAATDLGRRMAKLPVHPRLARVIVDARHPWLARDRRCPGRTRCAARPSRRSPRRTRRTSAPRDRSGRPPRGRRRSGVAHRT